MLETINITLVSTLIGFGGCFLLCFLHILRAFPEIFISGFSLDVLLMVPMPAIIAVSLHTVDTLRKISFEIVEKTDL